MDASSVVVALRKGRSVAKIDGVRVAFSVHQCFAFDGRKADVDCLRVLGEHLKGQTGLALYGTGRFLDYLLEHVPELRRHVVCVLKEKDATGAPDKIHNIPVVSIDQIPADVSTVFLCETLFVPRQQMARRLPARVTVIDPAILPELAPDVIPDRAWTPVVKNIYPIDFPDLKFA